MRSKKFIEIYNGYHIYAGAFLTTVDSLPTEQSLQIVKEIFGKGWKCVKEIPFGNWSGISIENRKTYDQAITDAKQYIDSKFK